MTTPTSDQLPIFRMATDLALAIININSSTIGDVPGIMRDCYSAVVNAAQPAVPVEEPVVLTPAVPVRKSVNPDFIVCLEDGKKFKSLKRHLRTAYNLTPEQYREKWSLPADYPMVAPNYSATRSKLAKDNGLGRK